MESYLELQRRKIKSTPYRSYSPCQPCQSNIVALREPSRSSTPISDAEDSQMKVQTLEDELKKLSERLVMLEQKSTETIPSTPKRDKDDLPLSRYRRRPSSAPSVPTVDHIAELEETSPRAPARGTNFPFHFDSQPASSVQQHQNLAPKRLWAMWQQYLSNVDPLLRLVHVPAVQHLFLSTEEEKQDAAHDAESVKFAMCFAAAASLERSPCEASSCAASKPLLSTYAAQVEASLAKSQFLSNPTIASLQALTLYLVCGQRHLDRTYSWSLISILVRLALKLKVNKEPEKMGLSFIDCEYRRRLWWHICTLDAGIAEMNKTDPIIYERQCTARFPSAIQGAASNSPQPSQVHSPDMFYSLLRFEITYYMRTVSYSDFFMEDNGWPVLPASGKLCIIQSLEKILDDKYYARCKCDSDLCKLAIASSKIAIAKLKLSTVLAGNKIHKLSAEDTELVLEASTVVLMNLGAIRQEPSMSRFTWLSAPYAEWDAATLCLRVLALGRWRPALVTAAWNALNSFFVAWKESSYDPELYKRWTRLEAVKAKIEQLGRHDTTDASSGPAATQTSPVTSSIVTSPTNPDDQRSSTMSPMSPTTFSIASLNGSVSSQSTVSQNGSVSGKSMRSVVSAFDSADWPLKNDTTCEDLKFDLKSFALLI